MVFIKYLTTKAVYLDIEFFFKKNIYGEEI